MLLAVHVVAVDLSMESFANLARGARHVYRHSTLMNQVDLQAMRAQPADNGVNVLLRWPKFLAQLFGSEPLVGVDRVWVLKLSR